ncbi:MAG: heme exporter protein CcmD [Rhodanobacter sp.]
MSASAWHDFFAMGGYAAYVWPAYAVFLAVLLADALAPALRRRRIVHDLRAQLVRQTARQLRHTPGAANFDEPGASEAPPRSA